MAAAGVKATKKDEILVSSFFMGKGGGWVYMRRVSSVLASDGFVFVVLAVIRAAEAAVLGECRALVLVHMVLHRAAWLAVGIVRGGIEIQAVRARGILF